MTKDFDRSIEKMMNESSVPPPFGMWNRIASELDVPAPAAPVAKPLVPRGVAAGFIAGASLITLLFGGVLAYNKLNTGTPSAGTEKVLASSTIVETATPLSNNATAENTGSFTPMQATVLTPAKTNRKVYVTQKLPVNKEATPQPVEIIDHLTETPAETVTPLQESTQEVKSFYFPPVDIQTGNNDNDEARIKAASQLFNSNTTVQAKEEEDRTKQKSISSSSSGHNKRIKFKKRKSGSFSYGKINRVK